jgi:hypothetical protein
MLKTGNAIQLSASDLVGHLNCRNLAQKVPSVSYFDGSTPSFE